jgi:flagellar biogenesis protein FliO
MDTLRQAGAAAGVLALLLSCLWWLRRKGWAAPVWRGMARPVRRLESIERLPLTAQHTLHLVRVGSRELLISSSPAGCALVQAEAAPGSVPAGRGAA